MNLPAISMDQDQTATFGTVWSSSVLCFQNTIGDEKEDDIRVLFFSHCDMMLNHVN